MVYFVAATLVHHNGLAAAIDRFGSVAYAIATDFVLYGIACVLEYFSKAGGDQTTSIDKRRY